jgi:hypothetical protein
MCNLYWTNHTYNLDMCESLDVVLMKSTGHDKSHSQTPWASEMYIRASRCSDKNTVIRGLVTIWLLNFGLKCSSNLFVKPRLIVYAMHDVIVSCETKIKSCDYHT